MSDDAHHSKRVLSSAVDVMPSALKEEEQEEDQEGEDGSCRLRHSSLSELNDKSERVFMLVPIGALPDGFHATKAREDGQTLKQEALQLEEDKICNTRGCVMAASNIISSLDPTADPCTDFFQYTCGRWNEENPIPDDKSRFGRFTAVAERVTTQMRGLLEDANSDPLPGSKVINMTKIVYQTCMNLTRLSAEKSEQLFADIRKLNGWPLLDEKWSEKDFDLNELMTNLKLFSLDVFWDLSVYADEKNTTRNILHLDQMDLGLGSRDYYLNQTKYRERLNAYKKYIKDVALIIAADANVALNDARLNADIEEILQFETKLANITTPPEDRRNGTKMYNIWTFRELRTNLSEIHWPDYFKAIMPKQVFESLTHNSPVNVLEPKFMYAMQDILKQTKPRLLANYLMWRFTAASVGALDDRFANVAQEFTKVVSGRQQRPARWKECVGSAKAHFMHGAASMYVGKYFEGNSKSVAMELIDNLFNTFDSLFGELEWMDEKTKLFAEKKKFIIPNIGYADFIRNATALDQYYANLTRIDATDSLYDADTKVSVWIQNKKFYDLLKPFDRYEFTASAATVNAFYSPAKNSIVFPAAILQPPFFHAEYPRAVNFGSMGAVIGHEITHAFDDHGSQYDELGNLYNWWSPKAADGFANRTKCMINQYGSYEVKSVQMKINGKLTQGENIADNGGLKTAYRAYKNYISKHGGDEPRLPGLGNMTNDQVFFLSFAGFWCGSAKQQSIISQILSDPHSPTEFRVIGTLSNSEEFARAFNCPLKTVMNPEKKCQVW